MNVDGIMAVLNNKPVLLLALQDCVLQYFALFDGTGGNDDAIDRRNIQHICGNRIDPQVGAICFPCPEFCGCARVRTVIDFMEIVLYAFKVIGMNQLQGIFSDILAGRVSHDSFR